MSTPREILAELQGKAPFEPGRAYRNFSGPEGLQIRAFVDGATRLPGISFRSARNRVPPGMQLPRIKGAEVTMLPEAASQPPMVTFELTSSRPVFSPIFVELAADLITDAAREASAELALLAVAKRLATWARFFDARGTEGLGRSAQLGLLGELLCLQRLGSLIGMVRAVQAWTGPSGTPHDFQMTEGSVEAKLSTSSEPERFRITSERQLDDAVVPWLALFAVLAQEGAGGTVGLPELVQELRGTVADSAPGATALLEERLLEVGYCDVDRGSYEVKIAIRAQNFLHVSGAFPRIVPVELRPGVFAVAYDIPWSAIAPYRISDDQVQRRFGGK